MSPEAKARTAGFIASALFLVVVPGFLFGPVLFNGVPVADIPAAAKIGAAVSALFGWWLAIVSYAAAAEEVEKVLEPFQGGYEVVLLFLPLMLWVGTKSVLRRCGFWRAQGKR